MLCALLRAVKIFFVGNTLFSSHAVVHLDRNLTLAAITYHLDHQALHIDHTVTLVQDARYHACFNDHPHTVTNRYLFLGPELKEKLIRLERSPFLTGGTRVAPCLSVNPYSSAKDRSEGNLHEQESQTFASSKNILPTKSPVGATGDREDLHDSSPRVPPSPSSRPTPNSLPRVPPSPRTIIPKESQTNTTSLSSTSHPLVVNQTVPIWVRPTSGRTIQPIRNLTISGANQTRVAGDSTYNPASHHASNPSTYNESAHHAHNESILPTELILESTRVWARGNANPRRRVANRNVTLADYDRVLSLMDSEGSEDSEDEWIESEESEDE